jgi:hypothetical protein
MFWLNLFQRFPNLGKVRVNSIFNNCLSDAFARNSAKSLGLGKLRCATSHQSIKTCTLTILCSAMTGRLNKMVIQHLLSPKILFVFGIVALIALNFYTLMVAIPETYTLDAGINVGGRVLAKDFSAYYIGAWRLWHNSAHVYAGKITINGEPPIYPQPEAYKYLPSFLVLVSPLLMLSYQQALLAFDALQFALLPLMALLLYGLLNRKGLILTFAVAVIALLQPLPMPNWGFSVSYFWQWGEGQAKVFLTFLLLLAFYLGYSGRPYLSGIVFAFGAFDPRFGLLALPLFFMYNRKNPMASVGSMVVTMFLSNITLLYPGTGAAFMNVGLGSGLTTPLYYYAFIPLLTLIALIFVNRREIVETFSHPVSTKILQRQQLRRRASDCKHR